MNTWYKAFFIRNSVASIKIFAFPPEIPCISIYYNWNVRCPEHKYVDSWNVTPLLIESPNRIWFSTWKRLIQFQYVNTEIFTRFCYDTLYRRKCRSCIKVFNWFMFIVLLPWILKGDFIKIRHSSVFKSIGCLLGLVCLENVTNCLCFRKTSAFI